MLELLRSYAQSQLSEDLAAESGWLHADYFLGYAEKGGLEEIGSEYANLVAALRWLQREGGGERALRLAVALTPYWESKGRVREGREWFETLLTTFKEDAESVEWAKARSSAGKLAWLLGDYAWAREQFEAALIGFAGPDLRQNLLETRFSLQLEAHRVGDYERVKELLNENLKLAAELGDLAAISRCWLALGNASVEQFRWDEARDQYEQSLRFAREAGNKDRIGQALNNLGNLAVLSGQTESARQWLGEALDLFREVDHHWHEAMCLLAISKLDLACGEPASALHRLVEASQAAPEETLVTWRVALQAAIVLVGLKRYEPATQLFGLVDRLLEGASRGTHPVELAPYDENLNRIKENIAESRFNQYWQIGRNMSLEDTARFLSNLASNSKVTAL
jgi:tetratricopeptide (TPR) repeat protein